MPSGVCGVVERRLLVNYRVELDVLDTVLTDPLRGREVGDTGKGVGSVCITRVEDTRPGFLPESLGVTVEMATHRVYARVEDGGDHCVYVPWRGVSSRFHALVLSSLLPTDFDSADFLTEDRDGARQVRVDWDSDVAGVVFRDTDRDTVDDDSVFYSVESASTFLCEAGVEYAMTGDVYTGVETCPDRTDLKPVEISDERSSYFGKLGGEFDSAFGMTDVELAWEPRR